MQASGNDEFEKNFNFMCYSKGPGILHFKLLAFSCGAYDHWAGTCTSPRSNINLTQQGSSTATQILTWWVQDNSKQRSYNSDSDHTYGRLTFNFKGIGSIVVTNLQNGADSSPITDTENHEITVVRETAPDRYRVFLEFDWYAPSEYMDKTWKVDAHVLDERWNDHWGRNYSLGTFDLGNIPEAPTLYDPVLNSAEPVEATDFATALVTYSSTAGIYSIKPSTGGEIKTTQQGGTFAVPMKDNTYSLNAEFDVDYNRSGGHMSVTSNSVTVPAYHSICDMDIQHVVDTLNLRDEAGNKVAVPVTSSRNRITWTTHYSQHMDAIQQDVFTIERAHKRDFSDATAIGSVNMLPPMRSYKDDRNNGDDTEDETEDMVQTYSFIDESPYYTPDGSTNKRTYYRVRRGTASMWGWNHRYAASDSISNDIHVAPIDKVYSSISPTEDGHGVNVKVILQQSGEADLGINDDEWHERATAEYISDARLDPNMKVEITRTDEIGITSKVVLPVDSVRVIKDLETFTLKEECYAQSSKPSSVSWSAKIDAFTKAVTWKVNGQTDVTLDQIRFHLPSGCKVSSKYGEIKRESSECIVWSNDYSNNTISSLTFTIEFPSVILNSTIEDLLRSTSPSYWGGNTYSASVDVTYTKPLEKYSILYSEPLPSACMEFTYGASINTSGCLLPLTTEDVTYSYTLETLKTKDGETTFFFSEIPQITSLTASQGEYLKQVALKWEISSPGIEYYDVLCDGKVIASNIKEQFYVDSIHSGVLLTPGKEYSYQVVGHLNCNGHQSTQSPSAKGWRSLYGRLAGRVLYADGTAMANVPLLIEPTDGSETLRVMTDERGHYAVDSVAYSLADGTRYRIVPQSEYALFETASFDISLTSADPEPKIPDFINTAIVRLSGRLLYEKSTVPVVGATFKVNGYVMHKENGAAVETDNLGNFTLTVPKGTPITLQAVRQGHTFLNDGFVEIDGSTTLSLQKNLDGVRIWDSTKVHLTGRIIGGNVQAALPLGQGLSTNNIGDDLQFVLELEGDNISHLVYDENDHSYMETDRTYPHAKEGQQTQVHYTQKRITVQPDIKTGEFELDLIPADYKVVQMTAKGYSTLLAAGTGIPTITLRNETKSATYVHTYHGNIAATYTQMLYGLQVDYLGERQMLHYDLAQQGTSIETTWKDDKGQWHYAFGHPVFQSGKTYTFRVSAHEDFYYNNDRTLRPDVVMLTGCPVKIYNGLDDAGDVIEGTLDEKGTALFSLPAANADFSMTGEDALRTVDFSVLSNGAYVNATPLQGYVTGTRQKASSVVGNPDVKKLSSEITVTDVLRDPPGAKSYAYIESGTSYETTYQMHYNFQIGANIAIQFGANSSTLVGTVSAVPGPVTGLIMQTTSMKQIPIPAYYQQQEYWQRYTYGFKTNQRIQTSSEFSMVGDPATIFVGMEPAVYAMHNESMCVIDNATFRSVQGAVKAGKVKVISSGINEKGDSIYLVIGEQMAYGTAVDGNFAYTRKYIEEQLIPSYILQRNALLVTGDAAELQRTADAADRIIYHSLVEPGDENFGIEGYYEMLYPSSWSEEMIQRDEVKACNDYMIQWIEVLINEEATQLTTSRMPATIVENISGGTSSDHSETTTFSLYNQDKNDKNSWAGFGKHSALTVADGVVGAAVGYGWSSLMSCFTKTGVFTNPGTNFSNLVKYYQLIGAKEQITSEDIKGINYALSFSIEPVFDINEKESNGETIGQTKTVGYHLEDTALGNLSVAVHRMTTHTNGFNQQAYNMLQMATDYDDKNAYNEKLQTADFVYTLEAGATRCPYEGPVVTKFIQPGSIISRGTLNLEEIHLDINTHEANDVPQDGTAYFDLALSVSSQVPVATNEALPGEYVLVADDATNDKGLLLSIDGQNLGNGKKFYLANTGEVIHKTLQVKRGNGFDFDNIKLKLISDCDPRNAAEATLSVHFMPASSPVRLGRISQNWVMNTLSPRDSVGYYLPVEIDGFDTTDPNFDHIEFQYKLSSESDDKWVNQCAYYPATDSLRYAQASGNKAMFTGGIISGIHFYGEREPMEQHYDLRAVTYTRHGSAFITASSEVLTGLKDTRCPTLFGVPALQDGVLRFNDYINIPFSEPIAGNYLDEDNNFEIVGYTNQDGITRSTSLYFDGDNKTVGFTKVSRTVGPEGFSLDMMIRPAEENSTTNYFCMIDETGNSLMYLDKEDNRLCLYTAYVAGDNIQVSSSYSKPVPDFIDWTRIAATYDPSGKVRFYVGSADYTNPEARDAIPNFSVHGPLAFGLALSSKDAFKGNMLEARLWNRTLSMDEIAAYNQVRLTGHEDGLLAYYPMNDGQGTIAADKAHGADLALTSASWTRPVGLSLELPASNTEGIQLDPTAWVRNHLQDYTLSLWFKGQPKQKDSIATLFAAGAGTTEEVDGEGHLFIGLNDGAVMVRQNGISMQSEANYLDGNWHRVGLIVNHGQGEARLYVDNKLIDKCDARSFTGIDGNNLYLGSCHAFYRIKSTEDGPQTKEADRWPFTGVIDEVTLWETALSESYFKLIADQTPNPRAMGLLCNLSFQRDALNASSIYETVYSPYNTKVYTDPLTGQELDKQVRLVHTDDDVVKAMMLSGAGPVRENDKLSKLNFNWTSKDNELVVNLNMADREINKQNIFVTLRDVEDLAGNKLVNPVSFTVYVDRSPVYWVQPYLNLETYSGETLNFNLDITNVSGKTTNYRIGDLPSWLSCDYAEGFITPAATKSVPFVLNANGTLTPGDHLATISLISDEGLTESIDLNVKCLCFEPEWAPDRSLSQSMSVIGQVNLTNARGITIDEDKADLVGAFIDDLCVGTAHISSETGTKANLMMSVRGKGTFVGKTVTFRLWKANTDIIYILEPEEPVIFYPESLYGTAAKPVVFNATSHKVQKIPVESGWNWVSFCYKTPSFIKDLFVDKSSFSQDDMIKTYYGSAKFSTYQSATAEWKGSLSNVDYHNIYMVYMQRAGTLNVDGYNLDTDAQRTVELTAGWTQLPYLLDYPLALNVALADYFDKATDGDVIKSYHQFAVFDAASQQWIGSLKMMQPGTGYMLRRMGEEDCTITFHDMQNAASRAKKPAAAAYDAEGEEELFTPLHYETNMSLIALTEGASDLISQPGDVITALSGNEVVGRATADEDGRFFLTVSAREQADVSFLLSRDGDVIGQSERSIKYAADRITGTLASPYAIKLQSAGECRKVLDNGHIYIILDGARYNVEGTRANY